MTRPDNLRSPPAGCVDTIPEDGSIPSDGPDRPIVVNDPCNIQFGAGKATRSLTSGFKREPSGDQHRAVVQRRRRMALAGRGHVGR